MHHIETTDQKSDLHRQTPYQYDQTAPSEHALTEPPAQQGSLRCDGVVGLRSPAAISLALSWAEAAKERDALATECRNKGDINEALWLENAAAAYTRCARELLQLTGCPDNREPEPNNKAQTRSP